MVLVPGNSLNTYRKQIDEYINQRNVFVISVNFVADNRNVYAFFGNQKRYNLSERKRVDRNIIISSNVKGNKNDIVVNYHSLINRGYKYFENSAIMVLNLLKRIEAKEITIAGFDGFEIEKRTNYADDSFQNDRHIDEFNKLNQEIKDMFKELVSTLSGKCTIKMLTPSRFEGVLKNEE